VADETQGPQGFPSRDQKKLLGLKKRAASGLNPVLAKAGIAVQRGGMLCHMVLIFGWRKGVNVNPEKAHKPAIDHRVTTNVDRGDQQRTLKRKLVIKSPQTGSWWRGFLILVKDPEKTFLRDEGRGG